MDLGKRACVRESLTTAAARRRPLVLYLHHNRLYYCAVLSSVTSKCQLLISQDLPALILRRVYNFIRPRNLFVQADIIFIYLFIVKTPTQMCVF